MRAGSGYAPGLKRAERILRAAMSAGSFHIWTIGCQMNVADSRRLTESLERYGLTAAETPGAADVVVLYSCVVRQQAEDRVHGQLHVLKQLKAAEAAVEGGRGGVRRATCPTGGRGTRTWI